ncbi:MAG TPA: hypothetical protein VFS16_03740 [Acidimicrobiia bacterium]|nr:hypothetical protein [Acidimicrobiia bacterium]
MASTTLTVPSPSLPGTRRILDRCPGCGGELLYTVFDGEATNFLCRHCNRCWSTGLGFVRRVDPRTCPGCEWRGVCTSRWDWRSPRPKDI